MSNQLPEGGYKGRCRFVSATLLLFLLQPAHAAGETFGRGAPALVEVALSELGELDRFSGTPRAREQILIRNLSRYFVTYPVPSDLEELSHLLAALESRSVRFAIDVLSLASRQGSGDSGLGPDAVSAAAAALLPAAATPHWEILFFPRSPTEDQIAVETIDLEAFRSAGVVWDLLLALANEEMAAKPEIPRLGEESVRRLAQAVNAYALLVLRTAGTLARQERAPYVNTRHADAAADRLAELALGRPAVPTPAAAGTVFTDVTDSVGLDFRHVTSQWLSRFRRYGIFAPTFSGGGVTATDLDGDDWPDLVICGGTGCKAFRNEQGRRFSLYPGSASLEVPGEARMAVVADLDNDGWKDLFITYARDTNRIFEGLPTGDFVDRTADSGLERLGDISGPAAAFDYDNDGLLDLYVGNFGNYLAGRHPWSTDDAQNAMPNRLYRNLGGFRFEDVTTKAGVGNTGWSQALSHLDYDGDGDQDLYVANDFGRNELYENRGDGTFEAVGGATGADDPHHGMNVSFADLNKDGRADIFVSNIWAWKAAEKRVVETNTLLLSTTSIDQRAIYDSLEDTPIVAEDTGWAWAAVFLDVENDGDDDLYLVNGFTDYLTFTQYRPHPDDPQRLYPINNSRETNRLFLNDQDMPSRTVETSGAELGELNSRAAAALDYDLDGDLDLVVTTFHARARLMRNDLEPQGLWIKLRLAGTSALGENRDAIGTRVLARGEDLYAWRSITGGEGYLSMSSPPVEIGLGAVRDYELEIEWPGQRRQLFQGLPVNTTFFIP